MRGLQTLSYLTLLAFSSTCASYSAGPAVPKVNVTVYVESLSFSCLAWYNDQVTYTLKRLDSSGILDLDLIPFGNAVERKVGDKWNITCQFGKYDCYGTFADACVKNYYPKLEHYYPFFICSAARINPQLADWRDSLEGCCNHSGMDYDKILNCVTGDEGIQLMHQNALKTGPHDYVPWVLVNGKHSPAAYKNFLKVVCDAYTGPQPDACK